MKKLFVIFVSSVFLLSCSKDNIPLENENLFQKDVKKFEYIYKDQIFELEVDLTNRDNPIVLDGKKNEEIRQILEMPNLISVINYGDNNVYYLYDSFNEYMKSDLYRKSLEMLTDNDTTNKSYLSAGVTVYRDSKFRGPSQGFDGVVNSQRNLHNIKIPFDINLPNNNQVWGDNISSLKLSPYVNLRIYEKANYSGRSKILNSYGRFAEWRDLRDLTYGGTWPFGVKNWDDDISSFQILIAN